MNLATSDPAGEARYQGSRRNDKKLRDVEVRVINWAVASRGGLPCYARTSGPVPDELDAELVERAMCVLRRRRPQYWPVVQRKWLWADLDNTGAQALRVSLTRYKELCTLTLSYLAGLLDAVD